jgi:dihydrolipoamide dehydrogenase
VKGLPQAGLELNKTTVISSDEALVLEKAPKTMAIVGAGAVGCEFADVFAAFGSQVTLIDVAPSILPLEDADSSAELAKAFKKRKIDVIAGAKIGNVKIGKGSVSMTIDAGGKKTDLEVEQVLVAAGRAPNVEDIGLKENGVQLNDRGFIRINEKMETSAKGIYAIGDVAGPPMLAHKAEHEGVICVEAIKGLHPHPMDKQMIPGCTYCHPQVASVGKTERALKAEGIEYTVGKIPFVAIGKAIAAGEPDGFAKLLYGKKHGELLGAHIIGDNATELIAEMGLALDQELTTEEIHATIHAHPTMSEVIHEATLAAEGHAIHF